MSSELRIKGIQLLRHPLDVAEGRWSTSFTLQVLEIIIKMSNETHAMPLPFLSVDRLLIVNRHLKRDEVQVLSTWLAKH